MAGLRPRWISLATLAYALLGACNDAADRAAGVPGASEAGASSDAGQERADDSSVSSNRDASADSASADASDGASDIGNDIAADSGEMGDGGADLGAGELRAQMAALARQVAVVDALIQASALRDAGVNGLADLDRATAQAAADIDQVASLASQSPPPRGQIRAAIVDEVLIDLRSLEAGADALAQQVSNAPTAMDTEQLGTNIQEVHFLAYALQQRVSAYLAPLQEPIVRDFGVRLGPLNPRRLANGHTLVAETSGNRVVELDDSGTVIWQYANVAYPTAAERLANGNTLIGDRDGMRAVEVDTSGTLVWQKTGLIGLYGVQRLDSSNTLLILQGDYTDAHPAVIVEVNQAGDTVWSYRGDSTPLLAPSAQRLPNGNTLIGDNSGYFTGSARVLEVDPGGNVVWTFTTGIYGVYGVRRLDNGNTLINDQGHGRLIEVNTAGELVWRYGGLDIPGGFDVLSGGGLLISDWEQNRLFEIGAH